MRIKFLSIIASFFMVSFLITSCLNDDNEVNYSPDATIHAFALDTIGYGKTYKFTIDQLNRLIYNEDSLPVHADTIIDRILIKTLTTASGLVTMRNKADTQDSIINLNDSIDLRPYVNKEPDKYLKIKVWAPDMLEEHTKEYRIGIRKHFYDPDSILWSHQGKVSDDILNTPQKTVKYGSKFFTYAAIGGTVNVYESTDLKNWSAVSTATGLNKLPNSILALDNIILATVDNKVYTSTNGTSWSISNTFVGNITTFISTLPLGSETQITYIKTEGDVSKRYFYTILASQLDDASKEVKGEEVGSDFPVDNISYVTFEKRANKYQNVIVGNHLPQIKIGENPITVAWGYDGTTWLKGNSTSSVRYCPEFKNPTVIYYNNLFYIWGEGFESIYVSNTEGFTWDKANNKFSFPYQNWSEPGFIPTIKKPEYRGRKNYSVVQDTEKDYIYILFGKETDIKFTEMVDKKESSQRAKESVERGPYNHDSEVWRGRLNSLWFIQAPLK